MPIVLWWKVRLRRASSALAAGSTREPEMISLPEAGRNAWRFVPSTGKCNDFLFLWFSWPGFRDSLDSSLGGSVEERRKRKA